MAISDNKAFNELRRLTECCICLMPFTDPRMLPCIHSACLKCFEDVQTKNNKNPGDVIPCPVCRKEFPIPPTGMSGLQKNFFIANMMEIMQNLNEESTPQHCKMCKIIDAQKNANEVTMKCLECRQTFCERCANIHKFNNLMHENKIIDIKGNISEEEIPDLFSPPNCSNHPLQVLNYYCGDCMTVVCVSCFVEKHKSHDCKDVTTVDKEFRKSLETNSSDISNYISLLKEKRSNMENKKMNLLDQTSEIENAIRQKNQQLKALVDQQTQLVLDELFSVKQKLFKYVETEIEEIELKMTILKSFEAFCYEIKSKGSSTDVCSCVDGLIKRADELKKENDEYLNGPAYVVEVKFNETGEDVLGRSSGNVIGNIEESTKRVKSYAVVVGGEDDKLFLKDVTKINLHETGDASDLQMMPTEMKYECAAALYSNSIYITGLGNNRKEIWKFDAMFDKWKNCSSLLKGRRRHSVAFVEKFLYICGGYVDSDKSTLDNVEAYDAINDHCSSVGKLVHSVQMSSNCVPFNSSLYIFGGFDANKDVTNHVQVFDTKSNTCSLLSQQLPVASSHMQAVLFEETVILLGKQNSFLYNLERGTWQQRPQFKTEVNFFGLVIDKGQIFVIGGESDGKSADGEWTRTYRNDVRCITVKNIMDNKTVEWRHHAQLPRETSVYAFAKIELEV